MNPMSKIRSFRPTTAGRLLAVALAAVFVFGLVACQPATGPERVSELRNTYEATLNAFNVTETPMMPEPTMDGEEGAEGEAAGDESAEGEGGEDEIVEEVPVRQDVMLDILLRKIGGGGRLDGVTLDVYQVDADEQDKANYRIHVETAGLNKGSRNQVSHIIEDIDFAEGDKFAVEVRGNVPPEVYPQYKEYADAGEGGDEGHED